MRSGIGLRGLAQRDPLNEFKAEAFRAFERLKRDLERYIVDLAMRGVPQILIPAPPAQALPRNLQTNAQAMAAEMGQTKAAGLLQPPRNGNGSRPTGTIPGGNGAGPASSNGARNGGVKGAKGGNGRRETSGTDSPARARQHEFSRAIGGQQDWPKRAMLLRQRQEVQDVPRPLNGWVNRTLTAIPPSESLRRGDCLCGRATRARGCISPSR